MSLPKNVNIDLISPYGRYEQMNWPLFETFKCIVCEHIWPEVVTDFKGNFSSYVQCPFCKNLIPYRQPKPSQKEQETPSQPNTKKE